MIINDIALNLKGTSNLSLFSCIIDLFSIQLMAMKLGLASIQVFILARPQCNMLVISKMPVLIFSRVIHCFYSQRPHILPSYLYYFTCINYEFISLCKRPFFVGIEEGLAGFQNVCMDIHTNPSPST